TVKRVTAACRRSRAASPTSRCASWSGARFANRRRRARSPATRVDGAIRDLFEPQRRGDAEIRNEEGRGKRDRTPQGRLYNPLLSSLFIPYLCVSASLRLKNPD